MLWLDCFIGNRNWITAVVTGPWQIFILSHTDVSIVKGSDYYYWFIDCINAHYYIITTSMRAAIDRYVIDFFVTGRYYSILKVTVSAFLPMVLNPVLHWS